MMTGRSADMIRGPSSLYAYGPLTKSFAAHGGFPEIPGARMTATTKSSWPETRKIYANWPISNNAVAPVPMSL
jgi:hypothetical protein